MEGGRHTRLIVDVVPGRGSGFSLEAPKGVRFLIRSRVVEAQATARPILVWSTPSESWDS